MIAAYLGATTLVRRYILTTTVTPAQPEPPVITATGVPTTLDISWDSLGVGITSYDLRYRKSTEADTEYITVNVADTVNAITITGLLGSTEYHASVKGYNGILEGEWSLTAIGTTTDALVPDKPEIPRLVRGSDIRNVIVNWVEPNTEGAPITSYTVRYKVSTEDDSTFAEIDITDPTLRTTTIPNLVIGNIYYIQVRATNHIGNSEWSTDGIHINTPQAPVTPDAPTLTANGNTLEVEWTAPFNNGNNIHDYDLEFYRIGFGTTFHIYEGSITNTVIAGLDYGRVYYVRIRADNLFGSSDWSEYTEMRTGNNSNVPDAIGTFYVSTSGRPRELGDVDELYISFVLKDIEDNGYPIQDYEIEFSEQEDFSTVLDFSDTSGYPYSGADWGWEDIFPRRSLSTIYTATDTQGLIFTAGESFARNDGLGETRRIFYVGDNPYIDRYFLTIRLQNLLSQNNRWIFQPAQSFNAGFIQNYLSNGQQIDGFYLRIRAISERGVSNWTVSNPVSVISPGQIFTMFPVIKFRHDENPNSITLMFMGTWGWSRWTHNDEEVSLIEAITSADRYEIQYRMTGGNEDWLTRSFPADVTTDRRLVVHGNQSFDRDTGELISTEDRYTIHGLQENTEYDFRIRATSFPQVTPGPTGIHLDLSDASFSPTILGNWSPTVTARTAVAGDITNLLPPAIPDVPTITNSANVGDIIVSWAAPDDNGNQITDYDVRYRDANSISFTDHSFTGILTTTTIRNLDALVQYEVQIRAQNIAGESGYSQSGLITIPDASVPNQPDAPSVITSATETEIVVQWIAPFDGSNTITGYNIRYKLSTETNYTEHVYFGLSTTTVIDMLTANTEYDVSVQAVNDIGDSLWSGDGTGRTRVSQSTDVPPDAPSKPIIDFTTDVSTVNVSWNVPDDGGDPIIRYELQYKRTVDVNYLNFSTTLISVLLSGLSSSVEYQFRVRAVNSIGNGAYSPVTIIVTPTEQAVIEQPVTPGGAVIPVTHGDFAPAPEGVTSQYYRMEKWEEGFNLYRGTQHSIFSDEITIGDVLAINTPGIRVTSPSITEVGDFVSFGVAVRTYITLRYPPIEDIQRGSVLVLHDGETLEDIPRTLQRTVSSDNNIFATAFVVSSIEMTKGGRLMVLVCENF